MIKKFTTEGRFECGLDSLTAGKLCALTPVKSDTHDGWGLGLAVANERGYYPIPLHWCYASDREEIERHADDLNRELFALDRAAALRVIGTSMFAKGR